MKIAISHYSDSKNISGVTTWLINLLYFLSDNGNFIYVQLMHFGDSFQESDALGLKNIKNLFLTINRRHSLESDVKLTLEWLNKVQPDIYLPQCLHTNYISAFIAGKSGLPWLLIVHSDDPEYWYVCEKFNPYESNGTVVSVSKNLNLKLQLLFPNNCVRHIPYGVKLHSLKTKFNSSSFNVLYLGRLEQKQKQIDRVLEVFLSSCSLSDKIKCYFIGDGSKMNYLKTRINSFGLSDRIILTGPLKFTQINEYLINSQVIVLMSDFEGLPLSLLEAMSFGVVPIVRNIDSGIPELVINLVTGFTVDNEIELVSKEISSLSNNPNLWNELSTNAYNHIYENYDQFKFFNEYLNLLKESSEKSFCKFPIDTNFNLRKLNIYDFRLQSKYDIKPNLLKICYLYFNKRLKIITKG